MPSKGQPYVEPPRDVLRKLIYNRTYTEVARIIGCNQCTITRWVRKHKLTGVKNLRRVHAKRVKQRAKDAAREKRLSNPLVPCECGCGRTLRKYRVFPSTRRRQRFIKGHETPDPNRRVETALEMATEFATAKYADEYFAIAYLAIQEGEDPMAAMKAERTANNQIKYNSLEERKSPDGELLFSSKYRNRHRSF